MKSLISISGVYGRDFTPGSRFTINTSEPFSVYHGAIIDVSKLFPAPAVPKVKIEYIIIHYYHGPIIFIYLV